MIILLSYDLNRHERPSAYADVKKMVTDHAVSFIKPLYSQWLIETGDSVQTWHDRMKEVTDKNDRWFLVRVTKPRQGWLSDTHWDWLRERS